MPPESESLSDQGAIVQFQRDVIMLKSLIAATLALLVVIGVIGVMVVRVMAFVR